jgi:hypothetical protein
VSPGPARRLLPCVGAVFGGVGWVLGWICGVGLGGVLFSESPPLKRKNSGQTPFVNSLKMVRLLVCRPWVGLVEGSAGRGNADLQRCLKPGKFEKLLRSDPEPCGWVVPGVSVV